jgi:hypothetical protein
MADEHSALLQLVESIDRRLSLFGEMNTRRLDELQHDLTMLRGESAETRESVAGLRDHMARDAVMVQRHMDQAQSMIRSLENVYDGFEDRAEKAEAFKRGREAERYRVVQFARKVLAVVSHRAFIALAIALTAAVNGLRWWGW